VEPISGPIEKADTDNGISQIKNGRGPVNVYKGREQTQAKHFILRRYLQALAFKVLHGWDITYVDGFSGPWQSETKDFSDTSFMIAIEVLKDAQQRIAKTGKRRRIRCFFSENDPQAYEQLVKAVAVHQNPSQGFEIQTHCGKFEDCVPQITAAIGNAFPLIFIDPTGWTGYPFQTIKKIFDSAKCEVLINFMYAFVSRFVMSPDASTIASLDPILGGPGWRERLDPSLAPGPAVEKLFRDTLKREGQFDYVISTKIDKSTVDVPHFFLAYGTKSRAGLKQFRQTEYDALKDHARNRGAAKERKREERTGSLDLFHGLEADAHEANIEELIVEQKKLATACVQKILSEKSSLKFPAVVDAVLQAHMLRETNVVCALSITLRFQHRGNAFRATA
jgi:three-Cys-motif partner protein